MHLNPLEALFLFHLITNFPTFPKFLLQFPIEIYSHTYVDDIFSRFFHQQKIRRLQNCKWKFFVHSYSLIFLIL